MSPTFLQPRGDPSCPSGDGTTYTGSDGEEWVLYCSTGLPGDDLPSTSASTYADCIASCGTYTMDSSSAEGAGGANCVAVTFASHNPNGDQCYLHYRVSEIRDEDYSWSARRKQYPVNGVAVYSEFSTEKASPTTTKDPEPPQTTSIKQTEADPEPKTTQAAAPSTSDPPEPKTTDQAPIPSTSTPSPSPTPTPSSKSSTQTPTPTPTSTKDPKPTTSDTLTSIRAAFDHISVPSSTSADSLTSTSTPTSSSSPSLSSPSSSIPSTSSPSPHLHSLPSTTQSNPIDHTATIISLSTTTSTPTSTPFPSPPPSGLSPAAKAGIGIGAAFAFLVLLFLGIYLLFLRRRRSHGEKLSEGPDGLGRMVREVNPGRPVEMWGGGPGMVELGRGEKNGEKGEGDWYGKADGKAEGGMGVPVYREGEGVEAWRGVHELVGSEGVAGELDGRRVSRGGERGRKSWVRSWGSWGSWGSPGRKR